MHKPTIQRRCSHCKKEIEPHTIVCPYCGKETRPPLYTSAGVKVILIAALLGFSIYLSTNATNATIPSFDFSFDFNFQFPFDFLSIFDDVVIDDDDDIVDGDITKQDISFDESLKEFKQELKKAKTDDEWMALYDQLTDDLITSYEAFYDEIEVFFDNGDLETYNELSDYLNAQLDEAFELATREYEKIAENE